MSGCQDLQQIKYTHLGDEKASNKEGDREVSEGDGESVQEESNNEVMIGEGNEGRHKHGSAKKSEEYTTSRYS